MKEHNKSKKQSSKGLKSCKGHYYRTLPRSKTQAIEKRLMEKILLSKLDPKAKEHQRKKVLRIFLSWNSKQPKTNSNDHLFWNWVKFLSPDNLNSSERFKSMSYEFLDKLISKKTFREAFGYWINNIYMPSLTKSTEDEHTRHFIQFIINCIDIKQNLENNKQKYLQNKPLVEKTCMKIEKNIEIPNEPGIYIEFRCSRSSCNVFKGKTYGFIGNNLQLNCIEFGNTLKCYLCNSNIIIINFGIYCSKFFVSGIVRNFDFNPMSDMSNYYVTIDEFHFYEWIEMVVEVFELTKDEKFCLDNLVLSSFSDPSVPKKKYCKRKGADGVCRNVGNSSIANCIIGLEKEIRDLDSQIFDLVADNYKNNLLIQELKAYLADSMVIERYG
ncbi:hypothetical protein SteCoe_26418 [Stentor coeruleus]|uniref:Uncharacterized protein n=1 Tax=Stentor coeruleus TaxID=5963 RepID=A0A1R2BD28_9CILI|nr:hypothetical protein SteCoe_26418 [Stentor coeruleus]